MKDVSPIWDAWDFSQGKLFGEFKTHGRVTVEKDWWLNLSGDVVGQSNRGPFRYYQRADGTRTETEVPNIKSIDIDRSIDSDAGECTIQIYNHWHDNNGDTPELPTQFGKPGYFTWSRGESAEAQARWNQQQNDWADVIVPNALIRTYQGYGGYNDDGSKMELEDAVNGEFITLTGTWFVDAIAIGSNGMLQIKLRDAAKLLIEQPIFKPLIPSKLYPLDYYRWVIQNVDNKFDTTPTGKTNSASKGAVGLTYYDSTVDHWYGYNASVHGHSALDSLDGNEDTFALSVGNANPAGQYCSDYWEYEVHAELNRIYLNPWAGNYTVYISIMENGAWQSNGEGTIEWSVAELLGTQYVPDDVQNQNTDIPFVVREGIGWESPTWYQLPRVFNAERIRITFRDHTQTQWGPYYYRCGIRELAAEIDFSVSGASSQQQYPFTFALTGHNTEGYRVMSAAAQQFAFGDARNLEKTDIYGLTSAIVAASQKPDGTGFWVIEQNGRIHSYGTAEHLGDPINDGVNNDTQNWIDIASTPSGNGYYALNRNGGVHTFGDASFLGNPVATAELMATGGDYSAYIATAMTVHPTGVGYWIVNGVGQVQEFGDSTHFGDVTPGEPIHEQTWPRGIESTLDGEGYWILYGDGHVFHFGNAADLPDAPNLIPLTTDLNTVYHTLWWDLEVSPGGEGLIMLRADGTIAVNGDANFYGKAGGTGQIRLPGNYLDYSDIVKELLLWAGFWLYSDSQPDGPYVHGNIESTGAYSDVPLDSDIFDKKPVIDGINTIKEIVGYLFWVDEEGGAHFESPNWWTPGNFFENGDRTGFIPEIDEKLQLTEYGITFDDDSLRSEIIISNQQTEDGNTGQVTARVIPPGAELLRGMQKPAMWTNEVFTDPTEQRIMAELIAMHIWFQQRIGDVTCMGNPCIQINDQVRIWERNTAESYIHYVRGVSTSMDLDSGTYTMTLTTHWLGSELDWVIKGA